MVTTLNIMTSYLFILQIKKMSQALCILPGSNKDRSKIHNKY